VVIDPGHGGCNAAGASTPGGVRGPAGTLEKQVTLDLARRVATHLGAAAVLTRVADNNLTLAERGEVARRHGARVFVSLHANGGAPGQRGAEAYVHDRAGPPSRVLAETLQGELATYGNPTRGVARGEMAVLDPERLSSGTAACLLEVDFLSDPHGERRLRDARALDGLGRAIASGIQRFLGGQAAQTTSGAPRARSLDANVSWPTRLSTLIPNDYARAASDLEKLHYVAEAIEAIDVILGVVGTSGWAPVVEVATEVEASALEAAAEGLLTLGEAAMVILAPLAAMVANFVQIGLGYAEGAEKVAERWGTKGFAVGVIWKADDSDATNFKQTRLWVPVGLPEANAFTVDNIKTIALRSYQIGVLAGMASAKELTETQKNNLFQDLRNRDQHQLVDWRQFDNATERVSFIENAALLFESQHLQSTD
jgi:hypothetical protein